MLYKARVYHKRTKKTKIALKAKQLGILFKHQKHGFCYKLPPYPAHSSNLVKTLHYKTPKIALRFLVAIQRYAHCCCHVRTDNLNRLTRSESQYFGKFLTTKIFLKLIAPGIKVLRLRYQGQLL